MRNENKDINNLINLKIQCHMLEKELDNLKDDLNKAKKINLMSKEYILVLESKVNEYKQFNENYEKLVDDNKTLKQKLKETTKKYNNLSENNNSLTTKIEDLKSENKKITQKLKRSNELCNEISANKTNLEKKLAVMSENFNKKEKDFQDISEEINLLNAENEKLNVLNEMYKSSTSWKITKPFRLLFEKFH